MNAFRSFVFFLVFSSSFPVFAEAYYWQVSTFTDKTPLGACQAFASGQTIKSATGYVLEAENWGWCILDGVESQTYQLVRKGDSCDEPDVYNSETGICETPATETEEEPACVSGESKSFKGPDSPVLFESDGVAYVSSQLPDEVCSSRETLIFPS
jgi:hypothetical protein